jgi:hypothetical protein
MAVPRGTGFQPVKARNEHLGYLIKTTNTSLHGQKMAVPRGTGFQPVKARNEHLSYLIKATNTPLHGQNGRATCYLAFIVCTCESSHPPPNAL